MKIPKKFDVEVRGWTPIVLLLCALLPKTFSSLSAFSAFCLLSPIFAATLKI